MLSVVRLRCPTQGRASHTGRAAGEGRLFCRGGLCRGRGHGGREVSVSVSVSTARRSRRWVRLTTPFSTRSPAGVGGIHLGCGQGRSRVRRGTGSETARAQGPQGAEGDLGGHRAGERRGDWGEGRRRRPRSHAGRRGGARCARPHKTSLPLATLAPWRFRCPSLVGMLSAVRRAWVNIRQGATARRKRRVRATGSTAAARVGRWVRLPSYPHNWHHARRGFVVPSGSWPPSDTTSLRVAARSPGGGPVR